MKKSADVLARKNPTVYCVLQETVLDWKPNVKKSVIGRSTNHTSFRSVTK